MENKGKKVSLQLFEETARNNGYEVFTPDEVASYYKEGIMKSRANELTAEEKEAFVADVMYLQKAVCADEEGKDVIRFYRPKQVEWETAADGTVMKGLEGRQSLHVSVQPKAVRSSSYGDNPDFPR